MVGKLLTVSQVAEQLGVHVNTIRRWSDLGYIDHFKFPSGYRRYTQQAVDRFQESMEQEGKAVA